MLLVIQEMRDGAETPAPPGHGKESIQRARFRKRAAPLASSPNSEFELGYFILGCI
jgi:hypothetical protein